MNSIEVALDSLGLSAHTFAFPLENAMIKGGIVSGLEKAHFLAQLAHESGDFKRLEENLNYSWPRLRVVFRKYFATDEIAKLYEKKPSKIASRVYANRMGNGNEASLDGWNYRGRTFIQLTGKGTYAAASQHIFKDDRLVKNPSLALDTETGADICVWFWVDKKCVDAAKRDDVKAVTLKINGGLNGLEDRIKLTAKFKKLFL